MSYDSTTQYVTKDIYEGFSGIDLDVELRSSQYDNPTQAVNIYLKRQQERLYQYMLRRYDTTRWENDWSDAVFRNALLWQIRYSLDNGEWWETIDKTAYNILREQGLANRKRVSGW